DLTVGRPETPLVVFDKDEIDSVMIHGHDGQSIHLAKKEGKWTLPDKGSFPADQFKVENLVSRLHGLKHGFPVTQTAGALTRFKVANDEYERKIVLLRDESELAQFYFGSSPTMRQVHARSAGSDLIYSVKFSIHDAKLKVEDWINKDVLTFPEKEIQKLEISGLVLTRDKLTTTNKTDVDGKKSTEETKLWLINPLSPDQEPNQEAIGKLVRNIAQLRISDLLGETEQEAFNLGQPELEWTVTTEKGEKTSFKMSKHRKEDYFVVKSSSRNTYFKIPSYTGNQLKKSTEKETIIISKAEKQPPLSEPEKKQNTP
ncbi:MAG: DUF4340 domain-containing protein, partial [SAR324 cluster bacterium]|nr:DUF4340 domain-containing protein [SAR324 cluster bacterium]